MRPEIGAQLTLSFFAHMSIFLVANRFLHSSEVPHIDVQINTTHVTDASITILWKIENQLQPSSLVKDAFITIYSLQVEGLTYTSPAFPNATRGQYTLTNLQPKMKYNICVIIRTRTNAEMNKCIGTKTGGRAVSGLARLKVLSGLSSTDDGDDDSDGGELDLTVFFIFLVIVVFIAISAASYNMYTNAVRAKKVNEIRYMTVLNNEHSADGEMDAFDVQIRNCQMEEPLLPPTMEQ